MGEYEGFLRTAEETAVSAGRLVMQKFRKAKSMRVKNPKDLVTEADVRSEKHVISAISRRYPGHAFLGEESGKSGKVSEYTWVIDPIDGTNNFAFGLKMFSVSIALLKDGKPVVGVMHFPAMGETFRAAAGGGAFFNGKRIRVSGRKEPGSMMAFYHADIETESSEFVKAAFERFSKAFFCIRMLGAATFHLSRIAMGVADVWVEQNAKPWDIAAGTLILEEAGGMATEFDGRPWTPWSKTLVATNGRAHDKVLDIVNDRGK